ncbi:hypothetical protein CONPUDRAFT_167437 [Coniophora puteana RWD-64-598 SS2]|uniref:Uncharacterized protein n=1 Tax=Coniophora puteana (strain RWD-64-598) TaxID=741705 RepID=A0A5M3MHE0_CONPW|nr:uncharacterized protein CONPUDRAFT_167437 [Coniophora puteana RWD-64-598 SS2]EIW78426.1 hypothetical protein CONPUDRAFT_167437 [Coniophora puteana RWD-64-598 SS2]
MPTTRTTSKQADFGRRGIRTLRRMLDPRTRRGETSSTKVEPPEKDRDKIPRTASEQISTGAPLTIASSHSIPSSLALVVSTPSITICNDTSAPLLDTGPMVSGLDSSPLLSPDSVIDEAKPDNQGSTSPSITVSDDPQSSSASPSHPSSTLELHSVPGLSPMSASNVSLTSTSDSSFLSVDGIGMGPKLCRWSSKGKQDTVKADLMFISRPATAANGSNAVNTTNGQVRKPNPANYGK